MELINQTAIPAELVVSEISEPSGPSRVGTVTAKATFDVASTGALQLSPEQLPVLGHEQPVELGFLPRDIVPPRPSGIDLVVLAAAHAPGGVAVDSMRVEMVVGDRRFALLVTGDRRWVRSGGAWTLEPAATFLRMPLTWERTFGGTREIWLDAHSAIDVRDPMNPAGRGFDPTPHEHGASICDAPGGFPRIVGERLAPNVEDPSRPVRASEDVPEPLCWAPLDPSHPAHAIWALRASGALEASDATEAARRLNASDLGEPAYQGLRFAHPTLRFPEPERGARLALSGCTPSGEFKVRWPGLDIAADYTIDGREGSRDLRMTTLVLLPEEARLAATFNFWFRFSHGSEDSERSVRLRMGN